ncbi:von Willebrand factor A domain-containing protein 7-like [Xenia sp. Carnegie-2017]|uniref:von Willebrand factor A domain-containing protein 7-like n=1 Tax=Xenia sp. Carnegie-2017 TaxID=2897299 RepID=UPI001F03E5BC|nr:von Willebrand factor A domain-containing protein 7-like [Xenia sp. Carnegie-2017]
MEGRTAFLVLALFQMAFISSAFDLYGSMDDARDAIMSFSYNPIHIVKAFGTKAVGVAKKFVGEYFFKRLSCFPSFFGHISSRIMSSLPQPWINKKKRFPLNNAFDIYGSMDDAQDAIMSFYDPVHTEEASSATTPVLKRVNKKLTGKPRQVKKKRISLNKFTEAMGDIEKAVADAQLIIRVQHDEDRLRKMTKLIKTAVLKRSYGFARKAIGEAMYTIKKLQGKRNSRRGKRSSTLSTKNFILNLKKTIGASAFNDLFAMHGQVTLMFAIDDTGSMSDEIQGAKNLATAIVNKQREEPVDYILSPFNDPGTGPVTYCDETQTDKFLEAISSLEPHGGEDCAELTFTGMNNAIDGGPQPRSPLYVFTDAGPKDANNKNITYLLEIAKKQGFVVNFFVVKGTGCSRKADITIFHKIAEGTGGQVFELEDAAELEKFASLTATSLHATADVSKFSYKATTERKKRSLSKQNKLYPITVDDSIDTMVISVTADQAYGSGNSWSVTSSTGSLAGVPTEKLSYGRIYEISNPKVGIWNLEIQSRPDVNYDISVKGVSTDNIDCQVYFVRTTSRRGVQTTFPISSPILGVQAEAILTVGGISHVNKRSLAAELVTLGGDVITSTRPTSFSAKDSKGIRYSFKFHPPNQIFKIKLKGLTKKGNSFERISKTPVKAETLIVKVLYARNDFTLKHGSTTFLIFSIENFGNNEVVDFKSFGNLGTVKSQNRKFGLARKGRETSFAVTFRGKPKATPGMTVTVVVSVTGRSSGSVAKVSVPLLVVE